MKNALIAAALLFAACTTDDQPQDCGAPPSQPAYAVHLETINGVDLAMMPASQYEALALYLGRASDWRICMVNGGYVGEGHSSY